MRIRWIDTLSNRKQEARLISHTHSLHNRSFVIVHLEDAHAWAGLGSVSGSIEGTPEHAAHTSDSGYLVHTSELLAIHRELHMLDAMERVL